MWVSVDPGVTVIGLVKIALDEERRLLTASPVLVQWQSDQVRPVPELTFRTVAVTLPRTLG